MPNTGTNARKIKDIEKIGTINFFKSEVSIIEQESLLIRL